MKLILIVAVIFGVTAFGLDAFFAHGLKNFLGEAYNDTAAHALTTASRYQLFASLLLIVLLVFYRTIPSMWILLSQALVMSGVVLFCVTIYVRHLFAVAAVAPLAPFGGISFMLSLLALLPLVLAL